MTATPIVTTRNLTQRLGKTTALHQVNLDINRGELVGILGPNGAGKTTLLSVVCGQRAPTSGEVRLCGINPRLPAARSRLGMTPQSTGLPANLKVREALSFARAHYPNPEDISDIAQRFGITELLPRSCGGLSGGQQRRVAVAMATIGRPDLLILDEPTTGLDVQARHQLWEVITQFRDQGGTVLMSSHYLEEIQQLASRIVVLSEGDVLIDESPEAVMNHVRVSQVSFTIPDLSNALHEPRTSADRTRHAEHDAGARLMNTLRDFGDLSIDGGHVSLYTSDADGLVHHLVSAQIPFHQLRVRGASLEEAFTRITNQNTTSSSA